jgi:hypothetical protein
MVCDVPGGRAANATLWVEAVALRCASLLLPIVGRLRATARGAATAHVAMGRGVGVDGAGIACKRVSGDGCEGEGGVAALGGGGLGWAVLLVVTLALHACLRQAESSGRIKVAGRTRGKLRSSSTGAGGDEQQQQRCATAAICSGGGRGAVTMLRLRATTRGSGRREWWCCVYPRPRHAIHWLIRLRSGACRKRRGIRWLVKI